MKNHTQASYYHKDTGLFLGVSITVFDDSALALSAPPDHIAIQGNHDCLSKRVDVDTGQVVDYVPPAPSPDHEWNDTAVRWQLSNAAIGKREASVTALARIASLDGSTVRALRELSLAIPGAHERLVAIEVEMAVLRTSLV